MSEDLDKLLKSLNEVDIEGLLKSLNEVDVERLLAGYKDADISELLTALDLDSATLEIPKLPPEV